LYLRYFGLNEPPFSITPDPAFVFLSPRHRDALAHLLYGIGKGGSGGFVQLTGEVGTGKTTLCRVMLEQIPDGTRIALLLNPLVTPRELLAAISEELEIDTADSRDSTRLLVDRLNYFLLDAHSRGESVVVVIDEAQNLSPEALEQVRLLTNLETAKEKLLQIVLLGQPELRELLQRRNLRQLAQRITARYHLSPLGPKDTHLYIQHRMQVAGAQRNPFKRSAMNALYQRSQGIPRLINIIADRSLVAAYARERADVTAAMVHAAANEVQLGERQVKRLRWPWLVAAGSPAPGHRQVQTQTKQVWRPRTICRRKITVLKWWLKRRVCKQQWNRNRRRRLKFCLLNRRLRQHWIRAGSKLINRKSGRGLPMSGTTQRQPIR